MVSTAANRRSSEVEEGEPALRLRFSVSFQSEHARMMGYLRPLPLLHAPPLHDIAFGSPRASSESKGVKYALFGPVEPIGKYNWKVLKAHVEELKGAQAAVMAAVHDFESVLFWRRDSLHLSVTLLVGFQLLLSYPRLLPSAALLIFLRNLHRTYAHARTEQQHPIHRRPRFFQICGSILPEVLPFLVTPERLDRLHQRLTNFLIENPIGKRLHRQAEGDDSWVRSRSRASQYVVRSSDAGALSPSRAPSEPPSQRGGWTAPQAVAAARGGRAGAGGPPEGPPTQWPPESSAAPGEPAGGTEETSASWTSKRRSVVAAFSSCLPKKQSRERGGYASQESRRAESVESKRGARARRKRRSILLKRGGELEAQKHLAEQQVDRY